MQFKDSISDRLSVARTEVEKSFHSVSGSRGMMGGNSDDGLPFTPGNQALGVFGGNPMQTQAIEQYRHNQGWVYASNRTVAQRIARQPLRIARIRKAKMPAGRRDMDLEFSQLTMPSFVKNMGGMGSQIEMVEDHAMIDAVNRPNPIMVRWSLLFCTVASMRLTGRHYWWCYRTKKGKWQIWPLPTHWVSPVFGGDNVYESWKVRPFGVGGELDVPATEIIPFGYPDPANPLGAISPLQANAKAVIADEFVQEAQKRAFMNSIWPGLAVVIGRLRDSDNLMQQKGQRVVLTDDQRENLASMIKSRFRGIYKTDEPAILDGFVEDIKRLTMAPREMDFLRSGESTKDRVTQGLGVNPISMGAIEAASRASSAVADDHLLANNVNPEIELISQTLTAFGIPIFGGSDDEVAYIEEAVSVDEELNQRKYSDGLSKGAVTINEYRVNILRIPPVQGGDVVLVSPGQVPLHLADKNAPAPVLGDVPLADEPIEGSLSLEDDPPAPAPEPTDPPKEDEEDPEPADANPDEEEEKVIDGLRWTVLAKHMSRAELIASFEKRHSAAERTFARASKEFFRSKAKEMLRRAKSAIHGTPINAAALASEIVGDEAKFVADFRRAMRAPFEKLVAFGAQGEWRLYRPRSGRNAADILFKREEHPERLQLPSRVREAVERYAKDLLDQPYWEDLPAGIRDSVARAIESGIKDGASGEEVIGQIDSLLGGDAQRRASLITRTETTGALNAGAEASRRELANQGLIAGKEWMCLFDKDTRPEHADANGQKVAMDQKFDVGGELCEYPGDFSLSAAMRCNCRCTSLAVIDKESLNTDETTNERLMQFVAKCLSMELAA